MQKKTLALFIIVAVSVLWVAAQDVLTLHMKDGSSVQLSLKELVSVVFSEETVSTTGQVRTYRRTDIAEITFDVVADPEPPTPSDESTQFSIVWNGTEATVTGSHPDVTVSNQGGVVSVTNSNTTEEFTYTLQGQGTGAFVLNGNYKATVVLQGLTLTGMGYGAALDIRSGKRTALVLADGTENALSDAADDLGQKAALYCKGHLEVSGAGALQLTGHANHALATKEYLQLKKTTGTIEVLAAANDGFHAGQYFLMNGGSVTMKNLGGDGIQAEVTDDTADEDNGRLTINGGTLDVTLTAPDAAALKSDSLMTVSSGTATLTTSGAGDKALKSKTALAVSGGDMTIKQTGKPYVVDGDVAYVSALKAESVALTGGTIRISNSVTGGRGISCSGDVVVDGAADIEMTLTGNGGTAADAVEGTASDEPSPEPEADYRVYVNLPASSQGGSRPGGGGNAWSAVALYKSDGTLVKTLTTQVSANGTTFYVCDFQKADAGTYYFGNPNGYQSGGGFGGGTTYTIRTSTFSGPTDGKPHFYRAASSYSTSGTTRTYQLSDVTSTYKDATIGSATTDGDGFTAKGIKTDGNCQLLGGSLNIKMSGTGAKGIKVEGNYTQGRTDGTGPTLNVSTTGASYGSSSSGGMGGGGGRPGESSGGSSSKAIKVMGTALLQGGETVVTTATNGAEGLETKTAQQGSIRITGGKHYFKCYDDCLNSAGGITFDGGTTVCCSTGNDAVDSNYGRSGAIVIGNGTILAYTSAGGPEEGLDCDNNSYIQITGNGRAVSLGGSQGGGGGGGWGGSSSGGIGSAVQGYGLLTTSASYSANRYYTLADASGNNLLTFSLEGSVSSSLSLFTAPGMTSGQSYTVKYATTAPTDATLTWHGLYIGSTAKGTSSTASFTAK